MAKFELPKLPYAYDALEPYIDARTMEIHHSKHHDAYVAKFNAAIERTELEGKSYQEIFANIQFWRTYHSGEIDLIEDYEGVLNWYEMKWSQKKEKIKAPELWHETYKNSTFSVITPKNYLEFLT